MHRAETIALDGGQDEMGFAVRFSETRLEEEGNRLRLIGKADEVLLEVKGHQIDEAVRAGFLDRSNFHFSMFEYARMRATLRPMAELSTGGHPAKPDFDRSFLSNLKISWD
jgi:hypothetical protein